MQLWDRGSAMTTPSIVWLLDSSFTTRLKPSGLVLDLKLLDMFIGQMIRIHLECLINTRPIPTLDLFLKLFSPPPRPAAPPHTHVHNAHSSSHAV